MTRKQQRDLAALEALFLGQLAERRPRGPWKRKAREAADRAYAIDDEMKRRKRK